MHHLYLLLSIIALVVCAWVVGPPETDNSQQTIVVAVETVIVPSEPIIVQATAQTIVTDSSPQTTVVGNKSEIVPGNKVSTNFYATGSSAWNGQVDGMHWGTDYSCPQGCQVRLPFDMTITGTDYNGGYGTYGQWVQGELSDGHVLYFGHLQNVVVQSGVWYPAGTVIGETNDLNHTHVQFSPPGNTGFCANSGTCLNFEDYYNAH